MMLPPGLCHLSSRGAKEGSVRAHHWSFSLAVLYSACARWRASANSAGRSRVMTVRVGNEGLSSQACNTSRVCLSPLLPATCTNAFQSLGSLGSYTSNDVCPTYFARE